MRRRRGAKARAYGGDQRLGRHTGRRSMPSITNPDLTLSESEGKVTLRVEHDAT
ncbi:hypothetical protein CTKZ_15070 [Cellulomonas algicola]|uniref:Uncharacterized protein n=1 Tax=Cellulomonas algicola TaxID=2071633 RepID=A0A401UZA6_9CELL|nr:hypothetical protein CTKZ_15070 [Cellulomonas algicola]